MVWGFDESSLHEKCAFSLHVSLQQQQQKLQQQRHHVQQGGAGGCNAGRDGASGGMDVSEVRWFGLKWGILIVGWGVITVEVGCSNCKVGHSNCEVEYLVVK